jgi:hypothetical protein
LRFLSWVVLKVDIQSGSHDSIVDARTALQLFEEYQRLEAEGRWDDELDDIYREGRRLVSFICRAPLAPFVDQRILGRIGKCRYFQRLWMTTPFRKVWTNRE